MTKTALFKKSHNPKDPKFGVFDAFNYLFLFLLAFAAFFPLYYVVIISLATSQAVSQHLIYFLPYSIDFSAYKYVFTDKLIFNSFMISVFITVVGTIVSVSLCIAAGYVLSKKDLPGSKFLFMIVLIPMYFGGGLIPYYLTMKSYGLVDNILIFFLPTLFDTFNLILLKNFFEELPASVEESAKIDGANDMVVLFRIVIPMSKPVIATISLFYAVGKWNDYFTGVLYISNDYLKPLQVILREIISNFANVSSTMGQAMATANTQTLSLSVQMAVIVVAIVPIFCVYPFLQKYFTKGIILGAVKE